jgi:CelD/BcsL family acetyltransferase involved in cellulose biosynthesis
MLLRLLEREGCDLVSIGPVDEQCGFLGPFESAAGKRPALCAQVTRNREGIHTVFHLPKTMEQFFDGMDKDERKKRKYEMRLLSKEPSITRDVITAPDKIEAEFESFATMHAAQWQGKGKLGHFGSWPRGKEYNLALVKSLATLNRLRFVRILSNGEVISSQYAFVFGNTWYWELPARLMDRKWNRYSLGTTGFFCLVDEALKEGGTRIEGGIAHYDYKQKLNGVEHGMEVLRVVANRPASRLLTRGYEWLRKCLLFFYYKIWYARISPRLPTAFRKPIWSFWLRLDF